MKSSFKPEAPVVVTVKRSTLFKLITYECAWWVMMAILTFTSIHLLATYIYHIICLGLWHEDTTQMALYLVSGAFIFLMIDKAQILKLLGACKLPFITPDQRKKPSTKKLNTKSKKLK